MILIYFIVNILIFQSINCYLFSVIMSIYNTERYLIESIESIINQSIGLKNIQLILVNDGSIDNSEQICLKYQKYYPSNIIYIKTIHSGPSKARNIGLLYAKGKYINFLDSDDKWDKKSFEYAYLFFKFHKNIDIIGGRIKYFEASNKYHFLDYKFIKTRVVNLDKEYNCIQLHASSSFFRYDVIKRNKFDENLFYGEDVKLISMILLYKPIIGILRESIYYYRIRADHSSSLQNSNTNINYYFNSLENIHLFLIKKSKDLYNKIIPFIQFYISYEFLFRIRRPPQIYLEINKYKKYCFLIKKIIEQIDEKYILEQKILSPKLKLLALSIKNSNPIGYKLTINNGLLIYSNYALMNLTDYNNMIIFKIIKIENNKLHLQGEENFLLPKDKYFYYCRIGNNIFYPKYYYDENLDFVSLFGIRNKDRIINFDITLEIKRKEKLKFYMVYDNTIIEIFPSISSINHIPPINKSYYSSKNFIIRNENNSLFIYIYKSNLEKKFESYYRKELKNVNKNYLNKIRRKFFEKKNKTKFNDARQIWIINDKKNQAGDNGEYFFRYLTKKQPKELLFFFAIEKNCSDYKRLKKYGNIVDLNSKKYLNLFLNTDKIITSVLEEWANNAYGKDGKYLKDLYHFDYIYLQSDIIKEDFSRNMYKIISNFDMIVILSKKQYNFLQRMEYSFNLNNIILSGFTRFDNLKRIESHIKKENLILIYLTLGINLKETKEYTNETYFAFYNNLTNSKELIFIMEKYDYKGIFCLDPNINYQNIDFDKNKMFQIVNLCNHQELFAKASLLITDYSNIFLDFGYMNKPIIYSHFDHKENKPNYFENFYFDYEKDGFGPVCYNLKCIINNIIFVIKNRKISGKKYLKRIQRFYKYSFKQNCERTFLKIKEYSNAANFSKNYQCLKISNIIIYFFISISFLTKLYKYSILFE